MPPPAHTQSTPTHSPTEVSLQCIRSLKLTFVGADQKERDAVFRGRRKQEVYIGSVKV